MREFYMRVKVDANLAKVLDLREGAEIAPPEMVKRLWNYIKAKDLKRKLAVPEEIRLKREERERLAKEAHERRLAKKAAKDVI